MTEIHVTFRVDRELERKVRVEAARLDLNRTQFIIRALEELLERIDLEKARQEEDVPNDDRTGLHASI